MAIIRAPARPSNTLSELRAIPEGAAGIRATLNIMGAIARQYRAMPAMRYQAEAIIHDIPGKNYMGEVAAIQSWVRDTIRYTQDVNGIETLKTPDVTIETGQGDCDDKSLLAATLLESIGHPAHFVAIASASPAAYDHVYVETKVGEQWYGVETTEPVDFPWAPAHVFARMVGRI